MCHARNVGDIQEITDRGIGGGHRRRAAVHRNGRGRPEAQVRSQGREEAQLRCDRGELPRRVPLHGSRPVEERPAATRLDRRRVPLLLPLQRRLLHRRRRHRVAPGHHQGPGLLHRPRGRRAQGHHGQRRSLVGFGGRRHRQHGRVRRGSGRRHRHDVPRRRHRPPGAVPVLLHRRRSHLHQLRDRPRPAEPRRRRLPRPQGDPRRGPRSLGDGSRRERQGRLLPLRRPQVLDVRERFRP